MEKQTFEQYTPDIPFINQFNIDFSSIGGNSQLVSPQEGPQTHFISCMGGISGNDLREQDFPIIFYGGGQYAPQYVVTHI